MKGEKPKISMFFMIPEKIGDMECEAAEDLGGTVVKPGPMGRFLVNMYKRRHQPYGQYHIIRGEGNIELGVDMDSIDICVNRMYYHWGDDETRKKLLALEASGEPADYPKATSFHRYRQNVYLRVEKNLRLSWAPASLVYSSGQKVSSLICRSICTPFT